MTQETNPAPQGFGARKIIIILAGVLLVAGTTFSVYSFFFKKEEIPQVIDLSLPTQIKRVSDDLIISATITKENKIKYYTTDKGKVFESIFRADMPYHDSVLVSSADLTGLTSVLWSPIDKNKVISIFNNKKSFYDFTTNVSTKLNQNIDWIAWSPIYNKIAYQYSDQENNSNNISIANPDGSNWEDIFQTRMNNLIIEWPSENKISLKSKTNTPNQSDFYILDISSKKINKILEKKYGLLVVWSPKGDKILFSETNPAGDDPMLKILDLNNNTIKDLDITTTAEKCVWGKDNLTLFCAIPQDIIPVEDQFWKINSDTLEANVYKQQGYGYGTEIPFEASDIVISPSEDYLIFINEKNMLLHSMSL